MSEVKTLPDLDIVRTWHTPVRAGAAGDGDALATMEVRFSKFNTWYRISSFWEGDFMERTAPGAFAKTIRESGDAAKILFNHGMDMQIDQKILGRQVSLTEEDDSPLGVVELFDTSYNRDLLPGLRAGAYGSSFMFRVVKDSWDNEPGASDSNPDGLPERTIREVRLFEYGPVTWPANPESTSGLRCMSGTDSYYESLRSRDPRRVDEMRSRVIALRETEPAASALVVAGAAPVQPIEPAERHSGGLTHAQRRARIYNLRERCE